MLSVDRGHQLHAFAGERKRRCSRIACALETEDGNVFDRPGASEFRRALPCTLPFSPLASSPFTSISAATNLSSSTCLRHRQIGDTTPHGGPYEAKRGSGSSVVSRDADHRHGRATAAAK